MFGFIRNVVVVVLLAAVAAAGIIVCTSADPLYSFQEILNYPNFHIYDPLIRQVGAKYAVDPMLIKAVIWRESGFRPRKVGRNGERGLMQVTEAAADDWARQNKRPSFVPADLFSPRVNIEAGTWYLKKALVRYASKDDPITFALAEYNAGKSRVDKWVGGHEPGRRRHRGRPARLDLLPLHPRLCRCHHRPLPLLSEAENACRERRRLESPARPKIAPPFI